MAGIRWAGGRAAIAAGRFAPVEIPVGAFGATRPLHVSQQHRILISHPAGDLLFGGSKVWVPALYVVDAGLARIVQGGGVEYFHLLLATHDVVRANGVASESLHLPSAGSRTEAESSAALHFFPELADIDPASYRLTYPSLKRHEAALLFREIAKIDPDNSLRHSA